MNANHHKLNQLNHSEILFPPKVLLHMRSKCSQAIIGIHYNVDNGIDESKESRMSAGNKLGAPPNTEGQKSVMDHVQSGDVLVLFTSHKEQGVGKLDEFQQKVKVTVVDNSH